MCSSDLSAKGELEMTHEECGCHLVGAAKNGRAGAHAERPGYLLDTEKPPASVGINVDVFFLCEPGKQSPFLLGDSARSA